MLKRKLGGKLEVSALALGCMSMSEFYGPRNEERSLKTIQSAYEQGITFFDTADMYGSGHNEEFLGKAVKGFRNKVVLATKFGIVRNKDDPRFRAVNGKPEYVKQQCEDSLKRLGVETIDLYYQHRVDPQTPIEETVQAMASLVKEGKVRYIGLSEASANDIRRAHNIHPITALQSEYSFWTREPEKEIFKVCQELNIGFVAYSPIGRGFFSGSIRSSKGFHNEDHRQDLPRFQEGNLEHNLTIVARLEEMATQKKCTPSQLALAWIMHQSLPIIPLFGTTNPAHLSENIGSLNITLTKEELNQLSEIAPHGFAKGDRYISQVMRTYKMTEK